MRTPPLFTLSPPRHSSALDVLSLAAVDPHHIFSYRDSGGLDTKRDNDEHEQLLRSCGWIIRADETEMFRLAKDITGRQLLSSSWCGPQPVCDGMPCVLLGS